MNRRETIKALMAASGALVTLPSWAQGWTPSQMTALHSAFSASEAQTLTAVADTIIPEGNGIGALTVGVDKFLQKLFADCYEIDVQNNIRTQLTSLDEKSNLTYQKSFKDCDQSQREQLLLTLPASEDQNQRDFFELIKSETIRGFRTSREVMVNYLQYKQAPGHYYGCVDVKA